MSIINVLGLNPGSFSLMSSNNEEFSYSALGRDLQAIRLLRVLPSDSRGYIDCLIQDAVIGQRDYIALSHVWGDGLKTSKIRLNGKIFWTRPLLWSFLKHAQSHLVNVNVWIDAICINQEDVAEKNRQIPLMGSIFSGATAVHAWLVDGQGIPHSSSSIDVNVMGADMLARVVRKPSSAIGSVDIQATAATLVRFLEHKYWTRLWVVQELTLARCAIIHWQSVVIDWMDLQRFVSQDRTEDPRKMMFETLEAKGWLSRSFAIFDFLNPSQDDASLISLMIRFANHDCSIRFDHAFALAGLASDGTHFRGKYDDTPKAFLAKIVLNAPVKVKSEQLNLLGDLVLGYSLGLDKFPFDNESAKTKLDRMTLNVDDKQFDVCSKCCCSDFYSQNYRGKFRYYVVTTEPLISFIAVCGMRISLRCTGLLVASLPKTEGAVPLIHYVKFSSRNPLGQRMDLSQSIYSQEQRWWIWKEALALLRKASEVLRNDECKFTEPLLYEHYRHPWDNGSSE